MKPLSAERKNYGSSHALTYQKRIYKVNHLQRMFGHFSQVTLIAKMYVNTFLGSRDVSSEHQYHYISSIGAKKFRESKLWARTVELYIDFCLIYVLKNKSDLK
jgi:hypothetical protein